MVRVLVVEDEANIRDMIALNLRHAGMEVVEAESAEAALPLLAQKPGCDAAILDVMLPGVDGFEVCRRLGAQSETSHIPVLMLTARGEEVDRVVGLSLGADDYVVKPFSIKVLLKRIEVVLKRKSNENIFMCGQVMLYSDRKQVFVGETEISLTLKEYQLLEYLIMNQNQVLTKEMIMENIWGIDSEFIDSNTISVMISRLKKKLNDSSNVISNVFGMGYRMGD